jgi:protein-S-isoprenylcysteine O-methyltransferase Ste14
LFSIAFGLPRLLYALGKMDATARFVVGCWGVGIAFWIIAAFSVKRTRAQPPMPHRLFYFVLTATAAILLNGSARVLNWNRAFLPHTVITGLVGDFLVFVGLLIAIWARITLGNNWSAKVTLKENHELIQRGPYRAVRHPIYSGLLLMILGTAILIGQVGSFLVLAFSTCGLWLKLRREEILLTQHLPGYSEYMHRTKALIPFVL